jgi:hypothetical protein
VTGKNVVSGISSTLFCLIGWLAVGELIGREPSWTAAPCGLFLGGTDRTESDRPGQAGQQAPSNL